MSNTHIREAVQSVVTEQGLAGYPQATSAVDAIVTKMEALAESAAATIREAADGVVSDDEVEQVLINAGLVTPEPVADSAPEEDRLSKVEGQVARLVEIARTRLGLTI